jgi:hypothetical protein
MVGPRQLLLHAIRVVKAKRHAKKTDPKRSSHWPTVRKHHLEEHGTCAACGGTKKLQVHHERPFHTDPSLELDPENLITLCERLGKDCHILIGHGDSFKFYNPDVVLDARRVLEHPEMRKAVEAMAKAKRIVNEPGGA